MKLPTPGDVTCVVSSRVRFWFCLLNCGVLCLLLVLPVGSATTVSAMPLISRGVPVFASGTAQFVSVTAANDDNHQSMWVSDSVPAWLAYDLSGVPVGQRQQVLVAWYASWAAGYIYSAPTPDLYLPIDYVIETNPANGGGSAPITGWQVAVTVTGNNRGSRQHLAIG